MLEEKLRPAFTVIVTRPQLQSAALKAALVAQSFDVFEFPLIEIQPLNAPEAEVFKQQLTALSNYDLVVFVSPSAISETFRYLKPSDWPKEVMLGVVGPGSVVALSEQGITESDYQVVWPNQVEDSYSSEGLLSALQKRWYQSDWSNKRVLILRGKVGRDWLTNQLVQLGVQVDLAVAYHRGLPEPLVSSWEMLYQKLMSKVPSVWLLTSSQGVRNFVTLMHRFLNREEIVLLKAQMLLVTHPAIAEVAREFGFKKIEICQAGESNVVQALNFLRQDFYQRVMDSSMDDSMTQDQTNKEKMAQAQKTQEEVTVEMNERSSQRKVKRKGNGCLWLVIVFLLAVIGAGGYWINQKVKLTELFKSNQFLSFIPDKMLPAKKPDNQNIANKMARQNAVPGTNWLTRSSSTQENTPSLKASSADAAATMQQDQIDAATLLNTSAPADATATMQQHQTHTDPTAVLPASTSVATDIPEVVASSADDLALTDTKARSQSKMDVSSNLDHKKMSSLTTQQAMAAPLSIFKEIDQDIMIANRQLQLPGGAQFALIVLQNAVQRLHSVKGEQAQALKAAIQQDMQTLQTNTVSHEDQFIDQLKKIVEQVKTLPLVQAQQVAPVLETPRQASDMPLPPAQPVWKHWLTRIGKGVGEQLSHFVRIEKVSPDAMLITPDQATVLRENMNLRLLAVRVSLLSHDFDTLQQDLDMVVTSIKRYFDVDAPQTMQVLQEIEALKQAPEQLEPLSLKSSLAVLKTLHVEG